jgi:hypothetical protein
VSTDLGHVQRKRKDIRSRTPAPWLHHTICYRLACPHLTVFRIQLPVLQICTNVSRFHNTTEPFLSISGPLATARANQLDKRSVSGASLSDSLVFTISNRKQDAVASACPYAKVSPEPTRNERLRWQVHIIQRQQVVALPNRHFFQSDARQRFYQAHSWRTFSRSHCRASDTMFFQSLATVNIISPLPAFRDSCFNVHSTPDQSWYWTVLGTGPSVRTGSSAGSTLAEF